MIGYVEVGCEVVDCLVCFIVMDDFLGCIGVCIGFECIICVYFVESYIFEKFYSILVVVWFEFFVDLWFDY